MRSFVRNADGGRQRNSSGGITGSFLKVLEILKFLGSRSNRLPVCLYGAIT